MQSVKIEIAHLNDAVEIAEIAYQVAKQHDEAVPEYFRPIPEKEQLSGIEDMFKDEKIIVFKAIYEEKIRGFLFLEMIHRQSKGLVFSKIGNILNFGVDETYRRKGIGTKLIKFVENFVFEQGGEALDLSVFAFNKEAIELYERLGYKIIDVSMRKVLK